METLKCCISAILAPSAVKWVAYRLTVEAMHKLHSLTKQSFLPQSMRSTQRVYGDIEMLYLCDLCVLRSEMDCLSPGCRGYAQTAFDYGTELITAEHAENPRGLWRP